MQTQLIGVAALSIWTVLLCYAFFKILHGLNRFRVSEFYEIIGIDLLMHRAIGELRVASFVAGESTLDKVGSRPQGEAEMLRAAKAADLHKLLSLDAARK